jgi:hypothetical protein
VEQSRSDAWDAQEQEMVDHFFGHLVPKAVTTASLATDHAECTAEECEAFARKILDDAKYVERVKNQGATSYTLVCPSQAKIVQFRLKRFDEEVLALAHQIYGSLVPTVTYNDGFPLPVYVSPLIPGHVHIFQDFTMERFPLRRQLTTVVDLARFVARAALEPRPVSSYSPDSWTKTAGTFLRQLEENEDLRRLEPRFAVRARSIAEKLPLLDTLPPVLSHADLAEVNILVDLEGHVTGVVDFEDAQTEAFGTCLVGVYEGFFGVMRHQKWRYFDQPADDGSGKTVREVLEEAFWEALWGASPPYMKDGGLREAVMVALDVGIVNRYFARGLLEGVDLGRDEHRISLEFARGLLLDR